MKLGTCTRIVGTLCTLWAALVSMELPGVHACAVHSPGIAGHHASHSHGSSDESSPHKQHCTCPGTACGSTPAAPPGPTAIDVASFAISTVSTIYPIEDDGLPAPLDFQTHFPNAPPVGLTTSPIATA